MMCLDAVSPNLEMPMQGGCARVVETLFWWMQVIVDDAAGPAQNGHGCHAVHA